ncbi:MAG: DNA topoisomerase I [Chloracidobacterium sp. CP2_5A]|nr:MAG: DNA topoisomerase I [Chloracidobacterium sp. CP2_5A]
MPKGLVVVESPAKAKTITKYLGKDFAVLASYGHIKDLPEKGLGVDVERGFEPTYEVIPDTKKRNNAKTVRELKAAARAAEAIYLAADPDREGEAICQHLREELVDAKSKKPVYRLLFNEITKDAIQASLRQPREINAALVAAQQARRVLDRLVGYQVSPMLNRRLGGGKMALSAGRVQSVALRLVVEREREILAFKPTEYWTFAARFAAKLPPEFAANLFSVEGVPLKTGDFDKARKNECHIRDEAQARDIERRLRAVDAWRVASVVTKEKRRNPVAPFITSTLQQEAARKLSFPVKKTMQVAQKLYEGVELGTEGSVGLITYMRTDSTRIADSALSEARDFIAASYGANKLPAKPNQYKNKKGAQDAHEAIRPTSAARTPDQVARYLEADELALYRLIWQRFIASQMVPAIYDATTVDIAGGDFVFRATGSVLRFAGFLAVYEEGKDERDAADDALAVKLPPVTAGEVVDCRELQANQSFTKPPARYTEATLVKTLEEQGIGRPSTYAQILSVIQARSYVEKREGRFHPTDLGMVVADVLTENFTDLFDPGYTASLESQLDEIEEGKRDWRDALDDFYEKFQAELKAAEANIKKAKDGVATDETCHKCGSPMMLKLGRFGKYLACSNPECKATRDYGARSTPAEEGDAPAAYANVTCEACGRPMTHKKGRWGDFLACTGYPECKTTRQLAKGGAPKPPDVLLEESCPTCGKPLAVKHGRFGEFTSCSTYPKCRYVKREVVKCVACPRPGCGGDIIERKSRRGATFYGCTNYPDCEVVYWDKPVLESCPSCAAPFTLEKATKRAGTYRYCADKEGCGWTEAPTPAKNAKAAPDGAQPAPASDKPAPVKRATLKKKAASGQSVASAA